MLRGCSLCDNMGLVQLFNTREAELREDTAALRQEKEELQYSISLLEEDNQVLREEIQQLRGELILS